jgi:hypothetical protein
MRKAFRVTTMFTGAATCAAAFTPGVTALAATTRPQQIEPDTGAKNCAIGTSTTSMVLSWSPRGDHGPTCIGSGGQPGTVNLGGKVFDDYCTGDNYGWFSYSIAGQDGFRRSLGFIQNTHSPLSPPLHIYDVHISGHRDDADHCHVY